MSLEPDEQLFTDALANHPSPTLASPDLARMSTVAQRRGTRIRRRRQGVTAVASLAVVGVGSTGVVLAAGGHDATTGGPTFASAPTTTPSAAPTPLATKTKKPHHRSPDGDEAKAYAVLDAPGWTCPDYGGYIDEKLYYVGPHGASVSLNWRPDELGPKYTLAQEQALLDERYGSADQVGTTTIDGDPAGVFAVTGGSFEVVGPVRQGRFLTLAVSGATLAETIDLATHVSRQPVEHGAFSAPH